MDRLDKAIEMARKYNKACSDNIDCGKCEYYNDNCELGNSIKMLLKWNKKIPKEQNIVLKNIDTSMSFCELRNKLIEDREKFDEAVVDCILSYACEEKNAEEYEKHAIEELWDMIQTGFELIQKTGISADEVMEEYNKYLEKIKKID